MTGARSSADAIVWSLVLLGVIVGLGLVVFFIRRRLFSSEKQSNDARWSLQHLRELHAKGQITDEEFQRLKENLLGAHRGGPKPRKDGPA